MRTQHECVRVAVEYRLKSSSKDIIDLNMNILQYYLSIIAIVR